MNDPEWTDADLALLQSLDAGGTPIPQIARRLGRAEDAIVSHLAIVRSREATLPIPQTAPADDEWHGPDEEGDVPPPIGRADDDPSAWVHRSTE